MKAAATSAIESAKLARKTETAWTDVTLFGKGRTVASKTAHASNPPRSSTTT
jgi:hypothetical protein